MFEEFQNGTNTVMNIKCDFVGCENQDSVFCATREQANNTLFERGWVIDSRKWEHFCKDHAAQQPRALDRAARCPNCKSKWDKFFCAECGYCKPPRQ